MLFSSITERSTKVRFIYFLFYGLLIGGGLTMLFPFLIMVSGSFETSPQFSDGVFFPKYLVDDEALWRRYLEAKYKGNTDLLRSAWEDSAVDIETVELPQTNNRAELWNEFVHETRPSSELFALGFTRATQRTPGYCERIFRRWLADRYGDTAGIARALGTQEVPYNRISTPFIGLLGAPLERTPLMEDFFEFQAAQSADKKWAWNAGGYYRAVFLPGFVGGEIAVFNARYGTSYASFSEVPFGSTVPQIAPEAWGEFVKRLLRSDFVTLTPEAESRRSNLGIDKSEFLKTTARFDEVRIDSLDTRYTEWAASKGVTDARIPQRTLDRSAFEREKGFWRLQFPLMNFLTVFDHILLHGHALRNTCILVILSIVSALTVNPLAAYALSRFKMKATYYLLLFFLATMAFPAEVTIIPVFLQLREFGLLNTYGALILPGLVNGFSIFLLKGFFDSLPRELYEAAEIDGASEFRIFWQFTMALSKPILAVIALGAFASAYGAFFFALLLAPDPNMWTVMVYIYQLRQMVDQPVVFASLIVTAIPTLLVFVFCQNIILRGIIVPTEK